MAGSSPFVGYVAAASGALVMPVVVLGADGSVPTDPPRPRSRIDVFFLPPRNLDASATPLRQSTRSALAERIRQHMSDAEQEAVMRMGGAA